MNPDFKNIVDAKMQKILESYKNSLNKIRSGRAHPGMLDHVVVVYHGSNMAINSVASINASDARNLIVQPWDKSMLSAIEKAIRNADLGVNPAINGDLIRVPMPLLTEERRKELIKVVKNEAENARIAIRNARKDANNDIKKLLKDKSINEDEQQRAENDTQKLTDKHIVLIDQACEQKERELMTI